MFKNENAFTLIEMLIVISIWSVLILFVMSMDLNLLEKQQEELFFEKLAFDVLYAQSLSTTTSEAVRINIRKDSYIIRSGNSANHMIKRDIPQGWSIDPRILPLISFDGNGRMKTPGNFVIETNQRTYKVIFPFGKGRFYVVEQ